MTRAGIAPVAASAVGNILEHVTRALAIVGGLILVGLAIMTVCSILGRAFIFAGLSPVKGDYEMVEMGCAIAIFCFLPLCQMRRGHVTVDVFINVFPARVRIFLSLLGNTALFLAAALIAWRLWLGTIDKLSYGEETYELGLPLGYSYSAAMVGAVLFAVVAFYTMWRSLNEMIVGEEPH